MKRVLFFLIIIITGSADIKAQPSLSGQQPSCYSLCNGAVHVINPGANTYHYLWNTGDTGVTVSNLCAGTYHCIVSDSNYLVTDTLSITLLQPAPVSVSPLALHNATCNGLNNGYVILGAAGGTGARYTFLWSSGYTGSLTDSTLFSLAPGNYSITITDINNCSAASSFTITQPAPVIVTLQVTNTTSCKICNGSVTVNASGGASGSFNYNWSNSATGNNIHNLCTGAYNVTVTDSTGCSTTAGANVFANQSTLVVSFSTVTNIDCHHPAGFLFASPTGNTGAVKYLWSTGSTAPDIFNLQAGVYQVSVTDSSGCFATATDTIANLGIIINTVLQQNFTCEISQGQIIIAPAQGTPPYAIHWSAGTTSDTLARLMPDTYTVTVTDQANCTASKAYNIQQINNAVSLQVTGTNVSCKNLGNGSAYVNITGGTTPYLYKWNTQPAQTSDTATGLAPGSYQVSVTDSFGCSIADSVVIDSNYSQVTTSVTIGNCDSLGSASASLATGIPPYTYLWNSQPAQITAMADSLRIGSYNVSVTDSVGCTRTGSASLQFSCTGYITGNVFFDANANCRLDSGENGIAGLTVLATNHDITFAGVTNLSGQYTIPVTATGGYKIITALNASSTILQYGGGGCGYFEICPALDSVTFFSLNDSFPNHNFGFVGSSDFDLAIEAGWTPVDTSYRKEYWILYANNAFLAPYKDSAVITFNYDAALTFQSGTPAPVNDALNHTLTWVVDSIPSPTYIWADRVRAFFSVPANMPASHELKNEFHIEPYRGDCDTSNNSVYTVETAGLPAQPIYKEVYPKGDITLNDSVLTYTIYFKNTGNDSVNVVKVTDSLSFALDPQSVVNIASSPLYSQFYMAPGAVLTWLFNPANLPDSAVNKNTSAGFVSFKAKLKADSHPGYAVQNKATVYFNAQPPLTTNTTTNYISFPTGIAQISDSPVSVQVFPNPANSTVYIRINGQPGKYDFELIDITGRKVKSISDINNTLFQFDCTGITTGVYIYGVYSNGRPIAFGKLVIK